MTRLAEQCGKEIAILLQMEDLAPAIGSIVENYMVQYCKSIVEENKRMTKYIIDLRGPIDNIKEGDCCG